MRKRYISARGISGLLLVLFAAVIISCGEKGRNETILPNDKLAEVYAGMAFVKELYAGNPVKYELALDSLLRVHGTDSVTVRISFEELSKNPEELDEVYTEAINIVEARSKADSLAVNNTQPLPQ